MADNEFISSFSIIKDEPVDYKPLTALGNAATSSWELSAAISVKEEHESKVAELPNTSEVDKSVVVKEEFPIDYQNALTDHVFYTRPFVTSVSISSEQKSVDADLSRDGDQSPPPECKISIDDGDVKPQKLTKPFRKPVVKLPISLPKGYRYAILKRQGNAQKFTGLLRVNLKDADEIKSWINAIRKSTNCQFLAHSSVLRNKKTKLYRRYLCFLSSQNKTRPATTKLSAGPRSRNLDCKAWIAIWLIEGDDYALRGLPAKVVFNWNHCHDLKSTEYLRLLRPLDEVRKKFEKYFSEGHSVNKAMALHQESFDSMPPEEAARFRANGGHNPTINMVYHWRKQWRLDQ